MKSKLNINQYYKPTCNVQLHLFFDNELFEILIFRISNYTLIKNHIFKYLDFNNNIYLLNSVLYSCRGTNFFFSFDDYSIFP